MTRGRRRAGTLATLAATLAASAAVLAAATARADDARIVLDEPVFDFGTAEQGTKVEHVFRLHNRGSALLRIDHLKSSCGCLAGMASAPDVPPGAEGRINVVLDTARIVGRTTKVITLYSNDPGAPTAALALTGQVLADLVADPTPLYLGKVRRGERVEREIRVVSGRPNASYEVTAVENQHPFLHATLERLPDAPGQRVVVRLDAEAPIGRFNDQLSLRTTSPSQPNVIVPVFGSVEGDVVVLPPQVTFGVARGGAPVERDLWIRNRGARPLALRRIEVPERIVTYQVNTVEEGQEYHITLRLRDHLPAGKVEEKIDIYTDHPDEGHLVVPLYAIVRDGRGRG
jgi:hypothetical protein